MKIVFSDELPNDINIVIEKHLTTIAEVGNSISLARDIV